MPREVQDGRAVDSARDAAPAATGDGWDAASHGLLLRPAGVRSVRREDRPHPVTKEPRSLVVADWVASTEDIDSYESILIADWDQDGRLERFRSNPVILWMHDRGMGKPCPAIGQAENVRVENRELLLTVVCDDTTEFDRDIASKIEKRVLRAGSVGFAWGEAKLRSVGDREVVVFAKNELREFSVCNVGSNPYALSQRDLVRVARDMARAHGSAGMADVVAAYRADVAKRRGEQRGPQPQTPAVPTAVTARDKRTMKTIIIDKASVGSIRRDHVAEVRDGDDTFRISIPSLVEVDAELRTATDRAAVAEKRAADLTTERDGLTKRAADAEERAVKAATAQADAEKARDAAIAERATVELEPLTGADHWQFTPAERTHVAKLAATDPTTYRSMVDERRAKGVSAGALKREEPAGHLPTRTADPTPRNTPAGGAKPATRSDDALFASAERQAEKQAEQRTPQLDAAN